MFEKLREAAAGARLRVGAWRRERKERAAEKRARNALNNEHGHGRFFLLHVPATATICAAVVEWYWAMLFCIEATGHLAVDWMTSTGSDAAAVGAWHFTLDIQSLAVLLGLICATIPIVMLSMVWLPVQFAMRGAGRWRRGSIIMVGLLANILVIVSGTVVMNYNRQDQVREALAVQEQATQDRGAIQAQIGAVNGDLARLTDRRVNNEYAATAANVGAEAYQRDYMSAEALARSPEARRDIIMRALGAARQADALREQRTALIGQLAAAPTAAAVAPNVEDNVGAELNTFAQYVEVWRPPFVAVICTMIGIFGAWWVLALLQGLNPRDVLRSGWADDGHRIEDLRDEEPVVAQQPVPPKQRRKVYNPETGREEVFVQPKGYWRSTGKKQKNADGTEGELTEFIPDVGDHERGVDVDGGARQALVAAAMSEQVNEAVTVDATPPPLSVEEGLPSNDAQTNELSTDSQPKPPFTDDELEALRALEAAGAGGDEQADSDASDSAEAEADGAAEINALDEAQDTMMTFEPQRLSLGAR